MMLGSRRTTRSATLGSGAGGKKPPPSPLAPIKESPHQPSSPAVPPMAKKFAALSVSNSPPAEVDEWEVRPGGMLVQKRDPGADVAARPPPPPIRVRVKYGGASHEVLISPQASFGDLKKKLSALTGLHPQDQKLLYKDKERDSAAFLDMTGVKDRSKIVLVEDPTGQARRLLEMSKNAKLEKAAKSVKQVTTEVDKLAKQVSLLESIIGKGKKVTESDVVSLTEQLMNQLLKLDAIVADGEVKQQRKTQVVRVQKFVETLDMLKIKNSALRADNQTPPHKPQPPPTENSRNPYNLQQRQYQQQKKPSEPQVVMNTANWETFDLLSSAPSTSSATYTTMATSTPVTAAPQPPPARFNWELF